MMHFRIGFTGTQRGMTGHQKKSFSNFIFPYYKYNDLTFHHGDCIGADEEAHKIISDNFKLTKIIVHPPLIQASRAFCKGREVRNLKKYIDRNHDIVDETDFIIATPYQIREIVRSGTWATIRYAKKHKKKAIIIYPDGTLEEYAKV